MKYNILCVGDIHGKHEYVDMAYKNFVDDKYDKLIFVGDYVDSNTRINDDMVQTLDKLISIKRDRYDDVVLLLGNHDVHYMYYPKYRCSGFRNNMLHTLRDLYKENIDIFQYAYQIDNYLFSHAGINNKWWNNHAQELEDFSNEFNIDFKLENVSDILNMIGSTSKAYMLNEVPYIRYGTSSAGGVLWTDKTEMMDFGSLEGLHQIVGHTQQDRINTIIEFGDIETKLNTSVTFIDVLSSRPSLHKDNSKDCFYSLEINCK